MSQSDEVRETSAPSRPRAQASWSNEINIEALLHQYILQVQEGRLHPEGIPVNTMERVVELGCGAGEWIFDLAKRYPRLHIYGIDVDEGVLQQAKIRRNISGMRQVELRQMNLLHPLPIPDEYIDFVYMRRCTRFIPPHRWPSVIQDCVRVLRPNGWVAIVELELCEISSPACMAVHRATLQARKKLGHTLDTTGTTLGVGQRLYGMLLAAALEDVTYDLHTIDLGYMSGNIAGVFMSEIIRHAFLFRAVVVQQGILSSAGFDDLIARAKSELQAPDLCGWAILITAYGRKAEKSGAF